MASEPLGETLRETLAVFDPPGVPVTTPEVADALDLGRRSTYERLRRLEEADRIETKKVGANARVWWRPPVASSAVDVRARRPTSAEDDRPEQTPTLPADIVDVLNRMSDGFYALDAALQFTFVNDHARTRLGIEPDAVGEPLESTLDPTDAFTGALHEALDEQDSVFLEDYYPSLDAWFENVIYPSETGVTVYFREVTERVQRERELERYEQILETVDEGIYVVDEDGYFTHANEAYATMTGWDREALIGTHVSTVVDGRTVKRAKGAEEALADAGDSTMVMETELERPNGETWIGEATFALMDVGDGHERIGAVRDVTARNERERELELRMQQQAVVAELGELGVENRSIDAFLDTATERVAETVGADHCKVLELDDDADVLHLRAGVGWDDGVVGSATVSAVDNESQAAHTLGNNRPVVVEDLPANDAFDGPDLLVDHGVRSGISVVLGSHEDPWGVLGVHDREPRQFEPHDVTFAQSVASILASAIDRAEFEARLVEHREDLAALVTLHEVVGDVTSAVVEQSTREEVTRTVCEQLAATDSYALAWVGDADTTTGTMRTRASAGVEGYLDSVTISLDEDDARSRGPTGRAFQTGEVEVSRDLATDPRLEPWRAAIERTAFAASAAIPVVHDDTSYGVLSVYTEREGAFGESEREVLGLLGEVLGQAIAAAERKRALLGDELVELEFRVRDLLASADADVDATGSVSLDEVVPVGDDQYVAFGTATSDGVEMLEVLAAERSHWAQFSVRERDDDHVFQMTLTDPPVLSTIAGLGGYVHEAVIEDGDYRLTIHLSPGVNVRRVLDTVESMYPNAELVRRVQTRRASDDVDVVQRRITSGLTDRQRHALEAAYHAGYFEWPRAANGDAVAATLDVSSPTFHQHLRKAEKAVFDVLFA